MKTAINELKRTSSTLTLKFTVINTSENSFNMQGVFDRDGSGRFRHLGGVHLIDAASKKKYVVVTDSDGTVLTSNNIPNIAPKSQITVWAKFPAPPDDVQKITFEIPHFIPVEDVPIIRYARERIKMRATVLSLAMLLQQSHGRISTLQTKVIDLVFRVQDMGGKVQDLNAKETTTEVRIELAADVLFDFDKAEILPKDGGATVGGPLHLVLIFGDRQSGSCGLALTGPAGDMGWLYDNLVLHAVGEWQAFHLVRIVAGNARSGSDEDRPRRCGSDQRPRSAGQLGDAFPCRFDEIADGHIVLGRIVHRIYDFFRQQRSAEVCVGAGGVDDRPEAQASVHFHRFLRGFGCHRGGNPARRATLPEPRSDRRSGAYEELLIVFFLKKSAVFSR